MSNAKVKVVRRIKTDEQKKKGRKIIIAAVCSVLAMVIVAAVVLGVINNAGFSAFEDYKDVRIESVSKTQSINNVTAKTADNEDQYNLNVLIQDGLKSTQYSLLRALFEGNMGSSLKFVTEDVEKKDEDGNKYTEKERVKIDRDDILGKVEAAKDAYVLTFTYARASDGKLSKSVKVEGEDVYFDTMRILLSVKEGNIIQDYTVYFYDNEYVKGNFAGADEYQITPVTLKAKGTEFKAKLDEAFDYIR